MSGRPPTLIHQRGQLRVYCGNKHAASEPPPPSSSSSSSANYYDAIISLGFATAPPPPPSPPQSSQPITHPSTSYYLLPTLIDVPSILPPLSSFYSSTNGDILTPLLNPQQPLIQVLFNLLSSSNQLQNILIHCTHGQSRSTTLSLILQMIDHTLYRESVDSPLPPLSTLFDALEIIHSANNGPSVCINPFLIYQLSLVHRVCCRFVLPASPSELYRALTRDPAIRGIVFRSSEIHGIAATGCVVIETIKKDAAICNDAELPLDNEDDSIPSSSSSSKRCLSCNAHLFDGHDVVSSSPLVDGRDCKLPESPYWLESAGGQTWSSSGGGGSSPVDGDSKSGGKKSKHLAAKGKGKNQKATTSAAPLPSSSSSIEISLHPTVGWMVDEIRKHQNQAQATASSSFAFKLQCPKCGAKIGRVDHSPTAGGGGGFGLGCLKIGVVGMKCKS
jgi:hypothetical protein